MYLEQGYSEAGMSGGTVNAFARSASKLKIGVRAVIRPAGEGDPSKSFTLAAELADECGMPRFAEQARAALKGGGIYSGGGGSGGGSLGGTGGGGMMPGGASGGPSGTGSYGGGGMSSRRSGRRGSGKELRNTQLNAALVKSAGDIDKREEQRKSVRRRSSVGFDDIGE